MPKKKPSHAAAAAQDHPADGQPRVDQGIGQSPSHAPVSDDEKKGALVERVLRLFNERPPMGGLVSLDLARSAGDATSSVVVDAHGVRLTLHLVVFEADESRSIRDIKEQVVWCAPTAALDDLARFEEYLRGWLSALAALSLADETAERLMPHDLVSSDVWHLKRPRTEAEFRASLLRKSRLGRLSRP